MIRNGTQRIVSKWRMMRIANKLKNLIMKNKRFKQTSILNAEDNQIDTSKDLQNVEQDEVKELTYSHTDGWSLVCYSRNGPSLEELNCSCCTVASCDWRYPVSKLVVELADTITIECSAALWRRTGGGEFEMLKTTSSQMNYGEHEAGVITLTWMRWWIQLIYCEDVDSSHS